MGLNSCYGILKCVVIFINLIFWVTGLAITVLSIWLLADPSVYIGVTQDEQSYMSGIYVLLAVGILIFILGILGCCGAYKESQCFLISFFCILLIVIVAEVAGGAWAYTNKDQLKELVKVNVMTTVQEEYGVHDSRTVTFDTIQRELHCCGAMKYEDWAGSKYNAKSEEPSDKAGHIDLAISSNAKRYMVPASCCAPSEDHELCDKERYMVLGAPNPPLIYSDGCIDKLHDYLQEYKTVVIGIFIAIALFEILALVLSLILYCAVRFVDLYKA